MNLNIKTTNMSLTPAISDYLAKKLQMIKGLNLERDNVFVYAELGKISHHHKSGDVFRAEINLKIGGHQIYAVSEKEDLYAAIDDVKDELMREYQTTKGKRQSLLRRGARKLKNILRFGRGEDNK